MGYNPPWYVHVLLDAAGAQWPDLDEDDFSNFALILTSAAGEMKAQSGYVSGQLAGLEPQVSADTFSALHQRWENSARPTILTIAHDMEHVAQLLFDIAQLIIKAKEAIIVYAGGVDLGEDVAVLFSAGTGTTAAKAAAGRALEAESERQLQGLEQAALSHVVEGKTFQGWDEEIASAVNDILEQGLIKLVTR
jgi:hypothetical protein